MFREAKGSIFVGDYAVEVYLPYGYMGKAYRGFEYYSIIGSNVRFFGVGMMRIFSNEKELENPLSVETIPLGIPMLITSAPSNIDVRDVQYTKNGPIRRCIVLLYYKDDQFMTTTECIKSSNNVMIIMNQLEGGKLDYFPPDAMVQLFQDVQSYNNVKLRIPTEEEEIFVAERYRDPANHNKKARLSETMDPDKLISYNMRQEGMNTSTYQAWTNEDINTSLIVSSNRHKKGITDKIGPMEAIVRGLDMSEYAKARDNRIASEKEYQEKHRG